MPPELALLAIGVSVAALFVAFKNYARKSGLVVRGSFSIASSIYCDDRYVQNVLLENLKDRAVTIFGIYLQVGHSYYIELEDLEDSPLILRAFETYRKEFGPIEFYAASTRRVSLDNLLADDKVRKRLVLSTSDGRYVVPTRLRRWIPVGESFRNHLAAVLRPVQSKYKDTYLGGNVRFVVEFHTSGGKQEIVPIHPRDYEGKRFRTFRLTKDSLDSRDGLEQYLQAQQQQGTLTCEKLVVYGVDAWRKDSDEFYSGPVVTAQYFNAFQFYFLGRLETWRDNRRLRKQNRDRHRKGP